MAERKIQTIVKKIFTKRRVRLLTLSFLHAIWLVFLTILNLAVNYITTDEEFYVLQFISPLKHVLIQRDDKPDPNRFLFVSISWDKALMEKTDENGFPIGTQTITDREKLAQFLSVLNQKPDNHKFLLLDVRFDETTPNDSALVAEFKRTRNYMVSYHKNENDIPVKPILPAAAGLSDYATNQEGTIVKFSVIQADTARTSPLIMYEKLHHKKYEKGLMFDYIDGKPVLNTFILDYRIFISPDSIAHNSYYHHVYLGELMQLPPEAILELTKDRIIIAGDFEDQDIHQTIYGDMPGSLVLLNAFLALENQDNSMPFFFILFLLAGFTLVSFICISQQNILESFLIKWLPIHEEIKKILSEFVGYVVILGIMSVVSYFLFNIHLTILLLAVYLQILDWIIAFFVKRRTEKQWKDILVTDSRINEII